MTVKREDLDLRAVDISDVASGRLLPPVHPVEILRDDFLMPLGPSVYRLARALKISRPRLGRYFGTTPEFWINLQARHDLDSAERTLRAEVERQIEPHASNADPVSVDRAGTA